MGREESEKVFKTSLHCYGCQVHSPFYGYPDGLLHSPVVHPYIVTVGLHVTLQFKGEAVSVSMMFTSRCLQTTWDLQRQDTPFLRGCANKDVCVATGLACGGDHVMLHQDNTMCMSGEARNALQGCAHIFSLAITLSTGPGLTASESIP